MVGSNIENGFSMENGVVFRTWIFNSLHSYLYITNTPFPFLILTLIGLHSNLISSLSREAGTETTRQGKAKESRTISE